MHASFARADDLVFDIGAHVGDRTGSFLALGARVVALEPQPDVFRALRFLYGRCPRAVLHSAAAGSAEGKMSLHLNLRNPTVATLDTGFIRAASHAPGWKDQVWDQTVDVPVTTLDALIARHGVPDFIKIDVEGHEPAVLQGLHTAVPALSFEFTTIQRGAALACIGRLDALGRYAYNFTLGEEHVLQRTGWMDGAEICAVLERLPDAVNSGDVFARRR